MSQASALSLCISPSSQLGPCTQGEGWLSTGGPRMQRPRTGRRGSEAQPGPLAGPDQPGSSALERRVRMRGGEQSGWAGSSEAGRGSGDTRSKSGLCRLLVAAGGTTGAAPLGLGSCPSCARTHTYTSAHAPAGRSAHAHTATRAPTHRASEFIHAFILPFVYSFIRVFIQRTLTECLLDVSMGTQQRQIYPDNADKDELAWLDQMGEGSLKQGHRRPPRRWGCRWTQQTRNAATGRWGGARQAEATVGAEARGEKLPS